MQNYKTSVELKTNVHNFSYSSPYGISTLYLPALIAHSISTSIIINIVIVLKYHRDQTVPAQIVVHKQQLPLHCGVQAK